MNRKRAAWVLAVVLVTALAPSVAADPGPEAPVPDALPDDVPDELMGCIHTSTHWPFVEIHEDECMPS